MINFCVSIIMLHYILNIGGVHIMMALMFTQEKNYKRNTKGIHFLIGG